MLRAMGPMAFRPVTVIGSTLDVGNDRTGGRWSA